MLQSLTWDTKECRSLHNNTAQWLSESLQILHDTRTLSIDDVTHLICSWKGLSAAGLPGAPMTDGDTCDLATSAACTQGLVMMSGSGTKDMSRSGAQKHMDIYSCACDYQSPDAHAPCNSDDIVPQLQGVKVDISNCCKV